MPSLESNDIITYLRQNILETTSSLDKRFFEIRSLSKIESICQPHHEDLPYKDTIIIAQTIGTGSCYCFCENPILPDHILGQDAREVQTESRCIDIAILDSAYSCLPKTPDLFYHLEGNINQKSEARANIVISEVLGLILEADINKPILTMVGAVGSILSGLSKYNIRIFATDFDETIVGKAMGGTIIEHGKHTIERIRKSNIILVTGMTLASRTLEEILDTVKHGNVRIVMFSETGGNFAPELTKLGVDRVISEEYPFYLSPGISTLRLYRKHSTS